MRGLDQRRDVTGRIEQAFLAAALLDASDVVEASRISAAHNQPRYKRICQIVFAAPHKDVTEWCAIAVRQNPSARVSGRQGDCDSALPVSFRPRENVQLSPSEISLPNPVYRFWHDSRSVDDVDVSHRLMFA